MSRLLSPLVALGLTAIAGMAHAAEPLPGEPRMPISGPLRTHPTNPRYFADATGRAVLLVGSHTWPGLVDMGPSDPPPEG